MTLYNLKPLNKKGSELIKYSFEMFELKYKVSTYKCEYKSKVRNINGKEFFKTSFSVFGRKGMRPIAFLIFICCTCS